jgi:DNA-binding transcriptional LysR family regulator
MALTLDQLRRFVAVAESLSVTETSRHMYVTQSAISHQIKNLEREFGQTFIKGNGRGVVLTEKGAEFWRDAERVLSGIDDLYRKYRKTAQSSTVDKSHRPPAGRHPPGRFPP